jgi:hypothetical protein
LLVIRFPLSRSRELLADAGSVELTKNPDAMISALRKIEGRGELAGATSAVMEMCVDNPREEFADLFATHPPIEQRIAAIIKFAGGHGPGPLALLPGRADKNKPGGCACRSRGQPPRRRWRATQPFCHFAAGQTPSPPQDHNPGTVNPVLGTAQSELNGWISGGSTDLILESDGFWGSGRIRPRDAPHDRFTVETKPALPDRASGPSCPSCCAGFVKNELTCNMSSLSDDSGAAGSSQQ